LQTLIRGLANTGLWLMVTLRRIIQTAATEESAQPRVEGLAAAKSGISLSNVSFAYGPHAMPVIHAADMRIEPGDHVAIVGPSGIGKSTLADLISGVLVPQVGMVLLDGTPPAGADGAAVATPRLLSPRAGIRSPCRAGVPQPGRQAHRRRAPDQLGDARQADRRARRQHDGHGLTRRAARAVDAVPGPRRPMGSGHSGTRRRRSYRSL